MEVYGDLISAGLEKLAAHPTGTGVYLSRIYYNSTSNTVFYYNGTSWIEISAGGLPPTAGVLVSATNPLATYTTITLAIAGVGAGQKIHLLDETYTEAVTVNKQVHLFGMGSKSNIVGAVTFAAGSSNSTAKDFRTTEDITLDATVTGVQILNTYLATTKDIIDNGSDNVYIAIGE